VFRVPVGRIALATCFVLLAGCAGGAAPTPIIVYITPEPGASVQPPATPVSLANPAATPGPTAAPAATPTPRPTPKATPKPTPRLTYGTLSNRAWAKLVKAPDRYAGKGYTLWACIWQFDAATGTDAFLAQASNRKRAYWWTDGENASFVGNAEKLADFVEDDVVVMKVVVVGAYSYDTQSGGNTTVPQFRVVSVSRKGGC
jgi:hypothetical protein